MCRGHDACGAMDVEPDVLGRRCERFPRVDSHPDAESLPLGPLLRAEVALRLPCGSHSIRGSTKRDEHAVALCVHLVAIVARARLAQDLPVPLERRGVRVSTELVQQACRPFNVAEDERDCSSRLGCHASRGA